MRKAILGQEEKTEKQQQQQTKTPKTQPASAS